MLKKRSFFIMISIFLIVGGVIIILKFQESKQQNQYFNKQEKRVEKFLEYNIPTFQSVKFTDKEISPMGIPYLKGYINNDKGLSFKASVEPNDHNFEGIIGMPDELKKLFRKDSKTYSEIIEIEKKK